ncbi:hypothetical protein KFE25_007076 [Diacronema lutheri]|uniref:Amine oxidase n=1 Tax=Diacronema lutheri TaxID=2081491 RepID=A0A8J6CCX6_DIALT|nr:hypothetical protein KFE25_007076 [Diacronema lutheri]
MLAALALACAAAGGLAAACPAEQVACTGSGTCCPPAHPWPEGLRDATCCGGGCCSPGTTCSAPTEPDGACCTDQPTAPCPAIGAYPARCCGRWTVCCSVGTVGCCDPALPWQGELGAALDATLPAVAARRTPHLFAASLPASRAQDDAMVHLLQPDILAAALPARKSAIVRALLLDVSQLSVVAIDASSGKVISSSRVRGYDNHGESTRPWAYSRAHDAFVTLEANFSAAPPRRGGVGRALVLTTIDTSSGVGRSAVVTGVTGVPVGYCSLEGGKALLVGLHADESAQTPTNASLARFVRIDLRSARATPVASVSRGADEASASFYAAHFYACAGSGSAVVRVGAQHVSTGKESGVGITQLGTAGLGGASSSFQPLPWAKAGGGPLTLQPLGDKARASSFDGFLSLVAPDSGGLALVRWDSKGGTPATVAKLGARTAPPQVPIMGALGYLADALSTDGSRYVALVCQEVLPAVGRWAVVTVELESGAVSLRPLSPLKLAATVGVSGLGLVE